MSNSVDYSFLGVEDLSGDRRVTLQNYGRANVSYSVTLSNGSPVTRQFRPYINGQAPHAISVSFDELYQLSQMAGGKQLIFDNLYTDDMEVRKALGLPYDTEEVPEIAYTREDVGRIVREGSDDELKDLVEFGVGAGLHYIAEWMKEELISVDSFSRRELIGEMLNIHPDALISVTRWMAEDEKAGELGFGSIKGLNTQGKTSGGTRRRRAGQAEAIGDDSVATSTGGRRRRV